MTPVNISKMLLSTLMLLSSIICVLAEKDISHKSDNEDMSAEKRLIRNLLGRYKRVGAQGRPVYNISTPTPVKFGLGLIQMDLDEKQKIIALSAWTRYVWRDEYMAWDKFEYDNITQIRLDPGLLWIPDIMLYNTDFLQYNLEMWFDNRYHYNGSLLMKQNTSLVPSCKAEPGIFRETPMDAGTIKDADVDIANRHALAVIDYRGKISWYPHTIFRASCSVDVTNFPFDHQSCSLWFGSWTYNSREMDLNMALPHGIDMSSFQADYKDSCAWDIYNVTSERKFLPDEKADPAFIVLAFDMAMRRKSVFSSYILTLPCIFLACLTLVVFCLPPGRPDRTSLSMSIFSSFLVLLLILVEAAPPTASSIPILGIYYCFNMVIIMASVILSSLVVSVSRGFSGEKRVSKYVDLIIGRIMGTIVFAQTRQPRKPRTNRLSQFSGNESTPENASMLNGRYGLDVCQPGQKFVYGNDVASDNVSDRRAQMAASNEEYHAEKAFIMEQWKYLALVLDRFFFTLYFILIVVSLGTLFPWPDQHRKIEN